jgi:hypothetical protein
VRRTTDEHWWITPEVAVLNELEHRLRILAWQRTKDGQREHPQHYPELRDLTAKPAETDKPDAMTRDELRQRLGWD